MLRFAWKYQERSIRILEPELKHVYWETFGRFIKKSMLKAFVEEVGHEFEPLMEEGIDDDEEQQGKDDSNLLTLAVTAQIAERTPGRNLKEESESVDEESDAGDGEGSDAGDGEWSDAGDGEGSNAEDDGTIEST